MKYIPKKLIICVLAFLSVMLSTPGQSWSLSCANAILEPTERIEKSEYVFIGQIKDQDAHVENKENTGTSVVTVHKTYKGELPKEVSVRLSSMWDSFSIKPDTEYLFMLDSYDSSTKTVSRGLCNYNATVATSSEAFESYKKILDKQSALDPYMPFIYVGIAGLSVTATTYLILIKRKKRP